MIPPNAFRNFAKATAKGALTTFGSTAVALVGAIYVERTAHRTLYYFFPHWYRDVDHAFGLEQYQLDAVKGPRREPNREPHKTGNKIKGSVMFGTIEAAQIDLGNCAITS
mmetsp:Transcript_20269/g.30482  ORF Transcript_20269/g.30482 Transcript_20269/m.30482 type:complete len:110 (+) Transcript_20269:133-462(+)